MLLRNLFESYGAAAGVETIRQLLHAVKDGKAIDLKVGPEMTPITYPEARYLLSFFKANRHLGDGVAKYFGDPNWIIGKLEKRDATMSPDRLNKFDIERMKDVQRDKVLDLESKDAEQNGERDINEATSYKGWTYTTDIEEYDDNRKIFHSATKDGKEVSIDWSPYSYMSDEEFKTWVDLDMPTRKDVDSIGPLSSEDLASLMKTKLGTKARLAQEEEQLDELLPAIGAMAGRAIAGKAASSLTRKVAGAVGSAIGSEIEKKFNEGTWHIPDTPELVQGLNKWFKQDRPVGKNAELIQKSLGKFIGDDSLYDDLEALAQVNPNIDGRSLVMSWINDHMPEIANAMKGEKGFVMYEGEDDEQRPPATQDYMTKIIAKKIKPGLDPDGEEFEDQAYLYHTSQLGRQNLLSKGGNWKAYYDAIKWWYKNTNEDVEEAKKDDITKKLDPKTRVALKKQQMKTAGVTKGDPIAALAMGLEKDVDRLDKENDEEEADIAAQELVDKYHTQELEQLKKMLDTLLKK